MRLKGLMRCTALQQLSLETHPDVLSSEDIRTLKSDLHQLQRLTSLRLGGYYAQLPILDGIKSLTSLLDLSLDHSSERRITLPEGRLPVSLTQVHITLKKPCPFTARTVSALAQLTALMSLDLQRVGEFSVGLLQPLKRLQRCVISTKRMTPRAHEGLAAGAPVGLGQNQVWLTVLTALTALQHLQLPALHPTEPAAVAPADFAAMTASAQLTHLDLSQCLTDPDAVLLAFPAQRRLLQLKHLVGRAQWLDSVIAVDADGEMLWSHVLALWWRAAPTCSTCS